MRVKEKIIERFLLFCASVGVLTTAGILWVLLTESIDFFKHVSIIDFFTDTQWTPLFAEKHFGILPLVSGTLLTTLIAVIVALPLGLSIAVYLNEYAPKKIRQYIKPTLQQFQQLYTGILPSW